MATKHDDLISWLNDAYSMELSMDEVLQNHAKDARDFPQMEARLRQHIDETREHAEKVKSCIESLGGSVSTSKAVLGDLMGRMKAVSTGMYSDEMVKNALSEYMTEHFEIASYKSLIAAADELGEPRVSMICREILSDEERMAQWVEEQIPSVTRQYLATHAAA